MIVPVLGKGVCEESYTTDYFPKHKAPHSTLTLRSLRITAQWGARPTAPLRAPYEHVKSTMLPAFEEVKLVIERL